MELLVQMLGEAITLHKAVDRFFEQYPEKELDLDRLSAKRLDPFE